MAKPFERSVIVIVSCFLSLCSNDTLVARTLKGTLQGGKYIAPNDRFSFAVPPNAKLEDKIEVIPVSHFYQRTFYPVPSSIEIPRKAEWLTVSFRDGRGLSTEIHAMPITGDTFTPLSVGLHRRTIQRFLQDIALPEWRFSLSKESWLSDNIEPLQLDGTDALFAWLLVPQAGIKGVPLNLGGAGYYLPFGVLIFMKGNSVYMLVKSAANYTLPSPEFIDCKKSLQEFYRSITFNTDPSLTAACGGLTKSASP